MSAVVDVGDAIELIFTTVPGATVLMNWLDPYQTLVLEAQEITENPADSGQYPTTLLPTAAGMWTAVFTASGTTSQVESYYVRVNQVSPLPPLASPADVAAQYGTMTTAQTALTRVLVRAASSLLRQTARQAGLNLDVDLAAGRLDPDVAALTVTNMVLRVLRNPNGLRSETTGPFSRTYDTTAAAGLLVVTAYDLAAVTTSPAIEDGIASLGIGTIRIVPGMAPPVGWPRRNWSGSHGWY